VTSIIASDQPANSCNESVTLPYLPKAARLRSRD
jgi:hypothetical protein